MTCRFCFRMFPGLINFGPQTVARSMEDPTVCEACYKVGTDLDTRMREQAAAQVDARTDGYTPNAHVIQVGDKVYPAWDLPQPTGKIWTSDRTKYVDPQLHDYQDKDCLPQQTFPPQDAYPDALHLTPEQLFSIGQQTTPSSAAQDVIQVDDKFIPAYSQEEDEIDVTPQGGKHTRVRAAFHHLDPELMLSLARVLYTGGAKYGRDNWKNISVEDHLNHALNHIFLYLTGETQEELEHAILRLMFAWTVENERGTYAAAN